MPNEKSSSSSKKKSSGESPAPKKPITRKPSTKTTTANKVSSVKKTASKEVTTVPVVENVKASVTPTSTPMKSMRAESSQTGNSASGKKNLLIVAAVLVAFVVIGGITYFFKGGDENKVFATYTDNDDKIVSVRIKDVIDVLRPSLTQASQDAIDNLTNIEVIRQVAQNVTIQPRFIVLRALTISNFHNTDAYNEQLKDSLKNQILQAANKKSADQIYKDLSNQQFTVATASRIVVIKPTNPEEDKTVLAQMSNTLETLKASTNALQDFRAAAETVEFNPRMINGYLGEVIQGTFPELDDVLFVKKAPEGLYPEIIVTPDAYQLVYVEVPAKSGKMKDLPDFQNSESFQMYVVNFLNSNVQVLYTYDPMTQTYLSEKNEPVNPETLTADTVVARFWKKNYTIAQVGDLILASAPQGAVTPQPTEVVQLLSDTNGSPYRTQLAVLLRSYNPNHSDKETIKLSNTVVTQLDNENSYRIIESYLLSRVETNVSAQEIQTYYNSLGDRKPVSGNRPDGTPIFVPLAELSSQIQNAIVGERMQQEFLLLMADVSKEQSLKWKDDNLLVLARVITKEYQKVTTQK